MAPNAQSQDPEAGDLARLPEVRHHSRRLEDGSECPMMSAQILVYIVGGIREILTSVAPLELRQV